MADEDILFVCDGRTVARAEYQDRVARAIVMLQAMGIGPGDVIGVALRNCPEFFEIAAAAGALGVKTVPVAWRLKHDEVAYLVEDSGAKTVFYDAASAGQMDGLPGISIEAYETALAAADMTGSAPMPTDNFCMELYSSGTTGRPKAIEREMPAAVAAPPGNKDAKGASGFLGLLGVGQPGEVHMMCGPLYHSQPIGFATSAMAAGHRIVMMSGGFDAEIALATIAREKVSWITCVPTHLIRMLALPAEVRSRYDLSSLKAVLHSAAPCPRDVKTAIMAWFPPDTVWEIYGGTEGAISMISPQEWRAKPGSVGRALPPAAPICIKDAEGNALPTGEAGLIYARPLVKFRYRGAPSLNDQTFLDDLYTLGDVGYLDADGYLFITDRLKDMIISGGANIYPAEIEAVLFNHAAVGDATVIGVPDPQWGERVHAIVERRGPATEDDIMQFCRSRLAHYKCPTSVEFIAALPRDPNGKVRKRELREPYWAAAGRAV